MAQCLPSVYIQGGGIQTPTPKGGRERMEKEESGPGGRGIFNHKIDKGAKLNRIQNRTCLHRNSEGKKS